MTMQDPIADLLTRVRNAQAASHEAVAMPCSKIKMAICAVLKEEGYIDEFSVDESAKPTLNVALRYHDGRPVIEEIKRISRPGLRVYKACNELPDIRGGLGVAIISTSRGVMTSGAARAQGMGGEVLCTVF